MRRLTIIRSHNDCRKTTLLQIGEQTYTSVFNGVVTMQTKTQAFLPLLIQGYIHAQGYARTVYVCAPPGTPYYHNTSCTADMPLLVSEMKENIKLEAIASHIVPAYFTTLTPGNLGCRALPCFDSFMSRLGDGSCVRVCTQFSLYERISVFQYDALTCYEGPQTMHSYTDRRMIVFLQICEHTHIQYRCLCTVP